MPPLLYVFMAWRGKGLSDGRGSGIAQGVLWRRCTMKSLRFDSWQGQENSCFPKRSLFLWGLQGIRRPEHHLTTAFRWWCEWSHTSAVLYGVISCSGAALLVPRREHNVIIIIKTDCLVVFRKIIAVWCRNHVEHGNALWDSKC